MSAGADGQSIRDLIDQRAKDTPEKTFLIDPTSDQKLTYGALRQDVRAVTRLLRKRSLKPGAAVGYAMINGIDAVRIILGTLYGGFLATAINLVSGKQGISHVMRHSAAEVVFHQNVTLPAVDEALGDEAITELINVDNLLWEIDEDYGLPDGPQAGTGGLLMYTSGTTGVPKGVVLTHGNLLAGGKNAVIAHKLSQEDCGLCVLPLYHINGLCVSILGSLVSGGCVIIPGRFSVSQFWVHLRENQGTWFSVVPTQISYLLREADKAAHHRSGLEQLRFGRSASAPLSPEIQKSFEARFSVPIIETMGLTETAAQILSNPMDGKRKIGSPGIAFGNEVIIADDHQMRCATGTQGEVLVRGPNVMRCYRDNPQATAASLTPDGWLRTGDLGRMDEDGYVFITGRSKELIIKGGENIAPREIDEALCSHPDVVEAAAFARPCTIYGQKVEAGVCVCEGSNLTETALIEMCRERVGPFKSPDKIHFFPELPKGPSGKIQRIKLAEMTV